MKLLMTVMALLLLTLGLTTAQRGPQADVPPAQDFSGKWIMNKETTDRSGKKLTTSIYLILKQAGNKLTGEVSNNTIRMPGAGGFGVVGWVEGNEMSITGYVDYQGGETTHIQLTFKDGHLAGTKKSWHDAPHKWRLDDTQELDYTKSNE